MLSVFLCTQCRIFEVRCVVSEALCLGIMNLVTCATRDLKINRNLAALLHKMQEQQVSNSCHLAVPQHLQLQFVMMTRVLLQLETKVMYERMAENILVAIRKSSREWNDEIRQEKPKTKPNEDFELKVRTCKV